MSAIINFFFQNWFILSAAALGLLFLVPALYAGTYYLRRAQLRARRAQREAREASETIARKKAFDAATRNCRQEMEALEGRFEILKGRFESLKKAYEKETGKRWYGH